MVSLVVNWKKAALNDITQNPTPALSFTGLKLYVASSLFCFDNSVTDPWLYQSQHTHACMLKILHFLRGIEIHVTVNKY